MVVSAVVLSGCGVSASATRHSAQAKPTVTFTTTLPLDLAPAGVFDGNACSVGRLEYDLNIFNNAIRLFGHNATLGEAETFGRTFYGCLNFTA